MIAPARHCAEGIESILDSHTGGLIVIGEPEDLSFLNSGGIKLDIDYTPRSSTRCEDGLAIILTRRTKITMANVS